MISLLNEMKAVLQMASPRIMRWAVTLRAYEYVIRYRAGTENANADALSHLPLPDCARRALSEERVMMLTQERNPEFNPYTQTTGAQHPGWVCAVGSSSGCPRDRKSSNSRAAASISPGHEQNKRAG